MMHRLKEIFDAETWGVWMATVFTGSFTLAQLDALLTAVMLGSTIIYTWMRILRKRKDTDDLE